MKKNIMMRLASFLLVAVLISTSAISGTYAKYVTEASGNDVARVAQWGVQLRVNGNAFSDVYEGDAMVGYSVDSNNGDLVVAPGTTYANNTLFAISGTPEVAVSIEAVLADGYKDVFLKAGTYTDFTKVTGYDASNIPTYGTFTLANDYYPVEYTLTQVAAGVAPMAPVTGNLETIKNALATYTASADYVPNTNLDSVFTLSWKWDFNVNDQADTWLGNAAAGIFYDTVTEGMDKDYCTDIAFEVTVKATQID